MKIPFSPPFVDQDVINEVLDSLNSGWITSGPKVKALEEEVCILTKVSHTVCVNSWTSGAILVLKWFGVKEGDEVIVPAYTYSATALAVLQCGATPVMVDVSDDFTINTKLLQAAITNKTKVIMPVDIAGWPCDYDAINTLVTKDSVKKHFIAEPLPDPIPLKIQSPISKILLYSFALFVFAANLKAQDQKISEANKPKTIWEKIAPFFSPPGEYKDQYESYRSSLIFYDGHPVKTAKDWPKRQKEILTQWNKMMGEWPPLLKDQEMKILDSARRDGFMQYTVQFYWTPNEQTKGYLLIPDGEAKKPAVITVFYEPETAVGWGKSDRTKTTCDFAYQLAKRGFVTLSLGTTGRDSIYYPSITDAQVEPLSMMACAAANAWYVLSKIPQVDSTRIGIMGISYGGKWAMFASCLFDKFACAVWSDPVIVFDSSKGNANYWEPWYLGYNPKPWRKAGRITKEDPATGLYPKLVAEGYDLQELHALMAPRPFLVSGGSDDTRKRWIPLNRTIEVNNFLGYKNRVAMTNRLTHIPTPEANEEAYLFFEYFLKYNGAKEGSGEVAPN